jgi:hypothetical protein
MNSIFPGQGDPAGRALEHFQKEFQKESELLFEPVKGGFF